MEKTDKDQTCNKLEAHLTLNPSLGYSCTICVKTDLKFLGERIANHRHVFHWNKIIPSYESFGLALSETRVAHTWQQCFFKIKMK
jgi:hypothetical protein